MLPRLRLLVLLFAAAALGAGQQKGLLYFSVPRSILSQQVRAAPASDTARFGLLRALFAELGCHKELMEEQPLHGKHGTAGKNLLCTLPGNSSDAIVIAAHYHLSGNGLSAIDDWSGAVLIPFLYQALQAQQREHTYIFLESWGENGTSSWVHSLSRQRKALIQTTVELDGLGVGETRYFTPSPFHLPLGAGNIHLQDILVMAAKIDGTQRGLPQLADSSFWVRTDDTAPFRISNIPAILIHSVPVDDYHLPGSSQDTPSAIDPNAYYRSYRLLCAYLIELDIFANRLDQEQAETKPLIH
jgi:hypothetical protein